MSVRNIWVSLVNQVYGLLGLAHGGTNVDLSATGGTSQVLKQVTAGAAITVAQLAASDLSNGVTGSGAVVLASNPVFVSTPTIQMSGPNINFIGTEASGKTWQINENAGVLDFTNTTDGVTKLTLGPAASTTGHVLRSNGAGFVDAALAAADLSNGVTGSGAVVLSNSPAFTGSPQLMGAYPAFYINGTEAGAKEWAITEGVGSLYFQDATDSRANRLRLDTAAPTAGHVLRSNGGMFIDAALAAADLSNGVRGSGAVVLSSGTGVSVGPGAPTSITTVGGIVTALTVTSDERLKDFKLYTGGLDEILAINPIRYKWNERGKEVAQRPDDDDREYVGFSAQDVAKAIPEAIVGQQIAPDGTTYLGFDDRPVIAAMVNAIKELTARVKELEAKNVSA